MVSMDVIFHFILDVSRGTPRIFSTWGRAEIIIYLYVVVRRMQKINLTLALYHAGSFFVPLA